MNAPLLSVSGLDVAYETDRAVFRVLQDVNLTVLSGEIVGIVGESGCGKSTLAATLLRLLPGNGRIASGTVSLRGQNLLALPASRMRGVRGGEMAMIFQDPMTSLNPTFRIGTVMVELQRSHGRTRDTESTLRARAIQALTEVGIPDASIRIDAYPHEFSGGQRQRVMIAMALLLRPPLLIADEPTAALDVTLEAQILELLRRLREQTGTAILFITHDLGVVADLCDRVVVMYAGRIVEEGETGAVLTTPRHPYTQALLRAVPSRAQRGARLTTITGSVPTLSALPPGCKYEPRCPHARDACRTGEPALIDGVRCILYDASRAISEPRAAVPAPAAAALPAPATAPDRLARPLIRIRGLHTHFQSRGGGLVAARLRRSATPVRAVDGVDLDIRRGEILGLVGESGSGKTTLGESILRLVARTHGSVEYDGRSIYELGPRELRRLRQRAQVIFQDPVASLSPRMPVRALLEEPYRINRVPRSQRIAVADLLEMVRLPAELAEKFPNQLSGGQARRVSIARALALRPEFLIADEPTAGLDVSAAASVINLLGDLHRELGLTYLIITHNLNLVAYLAHRIGVMYLGRLVELGPAERILADPAHPYTRALLSAAPAEPALAERHRAREHVLAGEIPSPRTPPPGCRFHTRCPYATARSRTETPQLDEVASDHLVACHNWRELGPFDSQALAGLERSG